MTLRLRYSGTSSDEQDRDYAAGVLDGMRNNHEIPNALVMAHRRGRLAADSIVEILENLSALPIVIDRAEPESVLQLAHLATRHQLTAYDAAYLEPCGLTGR